MVKRELDALLGLSSWCLVIVVWLFLVVPWVCLQFVIVVFPDHTHLLVLVFIEGDLISQSFMGDVLRPIVLPFMCVRTSANTGPRMITPEHISPESAKILSSEKCCSVNISDNSTNEHVNYIFGQRVRCMLLPPINL